MRGFVRAYWGDLIVKDLNLRRCNRRVQWDIKLLAKNKYEDMIDAITLVFGEENYKMLTDLGFDCVLVDKQSCFEGDEHHLRHKIYALHYASHIFDEFVFLDFDTMLIKPLPDVFWEEHYSKDNLQISLMYYDEECAPWRKNDKNYVPCACYIYMRNTKHVSSGLVEMMLSTPLCYTDEQVLALYLDSVDNGWQGKQKYWELHEPEFYVYSSRRMEANLPFPNPPRKEKICFEHCQHPQTRLKFIEQGRTYNWSKEAP